MKHTKGKKIRKTNKALVFNRNGIFISKLLIRVWIFLLIGNIMFFALGTAVLSVEARLPSQESNNDLVTNEQIHIETYIDNIADTLIIGSFSKESVIRINYTVLPQSNSSVDFVFHYAYLDYTTWLPIPMNFTLAVGESFSGDFTLNRTINQSSLPFGFDAQVVDGGTNATVHWWYEVLVTGKISTGGFFFLSSSLILFSLGVIIISKRKSIKKE
ncbi:MAG: hypothetical protein ACTSPM_07795 [Candidatus Heimdallarchaeota archaeon]